MKIAGNRLVARASAILSACAILFAFISSGWLLINRNETIRNLEANLSREAGIVGERLDGIFRATYVILSVLSRDSSSLGEYALSIPEVSNLLLLSDSGRVETAAYPRPRLSIVSAPSLDRLRNGNQFEAGAISLPFESSQTIALMFRREKSDGTYFGAACAVFTDRLLIDTLTSLQGAAVQSIYVTDEAKNILLSSSRIPSIVAAVQPHDSSITGSYQLRSLPLRVFLVAEKDALLAPRNHSHIIQTIVLFAFSLFFGFISAYASALIRGERRSASLSRELEHRDALFREVNHRVKNDLQIVRSVLSLGMDSCAETDTVAKNALRAAEDRINSISLVHEQLYKRAAIATTDFSLYLKDLAAYLRESYGAGRPIDVTVDADSGLSLSMDAAVPCGLLLNELMTNAFKYAFPQGMSGRLSIRAARTASGGIELLVSDDGVGFAKPEKTRYDSSYGLVLVASLGKQLGAEIHQEGGPGEGTRWRIILPQAACRASII